MKFDFMEFGCFEIHYSTKMNDHQSLFSQGCRLILQGYNEIRHSNPTEARSELLSVIRVLQTNLRPTSQRGAGGPRRNGYHQREATRQLNRFFNNHVPLPEDLYIEDHGNYT